MKGVVENMVCFIKIQSENMKMTSMTLVYLYFIAFANFLNVMDLQFCE